MDIINILREAARILGAKPLFLLDDKLRAEKLTELRQAGEVLRQKMTATEKETPAYRAVENFLAVLSAGEVDEYALAKALEGIHNAVRDAAPPEIIKDLAEFKRYLDIFVYRTRHHKTRNEQIERICSRLPLDKRAEHDQKMLKERLIFYVVEYTLEVARLFKILKPEERRLLIDKGMKVPTGNLPGLKEFYKSYQDEAAYTVCDEQEREHLMKIFLDYEGTLKGDDYGVIIKGLDGFNRELLKVALKFGINSFTGLILKPYPDNTPIEKIIAELS